MENRLIQKLSGALLPLLALTSTALANTGFPPSCFQADDPALEQADQTYNICALGCFDIDVRQYPNAIAGDQCVEMYCPSPPLICPSPADVVN